MQKSRAYRATSVKQVSVERVLEGRPAGAVHVGLDVGKEEIYAVVRWSDGTFGRPWKALNPSEVDMLVEVLGKISTRHPLTAAMESTGTYGDVLRARLGQAGVVLDRVGGKAASDYAEVFDGVPSQHDGKDAAVIAELAAYGKARPWPYHEATETEAILAQASSAFRLMYMALRQCGARPGELCQATIADVNRTANAIILREHKTVHKTGQPRRIPIGRKLGALLDQAIGNRTEGPIFLSPAGKAWTVPNLSRTYSRLRDDAGLSRELVLYLARHECGTKICREKGIEFARRLLGHANISTTQRYMHLDDRELADAQDLVE